MGLLLGIDFGTSYFKVGVFAANGACLGLRRVAVARAAPQPGRSELPVERFWHLLRHGLAGALADGGQRAADIAAVSYSSQANTFVLLDGRDQPLTPFVVWDDRRAMPLEPRLRALGAVEVFRGTTGIGSWTGEFAPAKWRWFQAHEPACWRAARRIMTLSDYFTHALTGEAVGDASTAAMTGAYALAAGAWWSEALACAGVAPEQLSRPLRPGTLAGRTTARAHDLLGLPPGAACAVGGLDHYMAAIGSGLNRLAEASLSTGTVLAALRVVDRVEPVADCYHGPHFDGRYYRLAFEAEGAGQLEDYQRRFAPDLAIEQLVALAAGPTAPASDGERQHALRVREMLDRMNASQRILMQHLHAGPAPRRVVATGGGARSRAWLQLLADALDATVVAPGFAEPGCLGAAVFAAVATGHFATIPDALAAMVQAGEPITPRSAAARKAGRPGVAPPRNNKT